MWKSCHPLIHFMCNPWGRSNWNRARSLSTDFENNVRGSVCELQNCECLNVNHHVQVYHSPNVRAPTKGIGIKRVMCHCLQSDSAGGYDLSYRSANITISTAMVMHVRVHYAKLLGFHLWDELQSCKHTHWKNPGQVYQGRWCQCSSRGIPANIWISKIWTPSVASIASGALMARGPGGGLGPWRGQGAEPLEASGF